MTQLYAQPYDISATGFYFHTRAEYAQKAAKNRNQSGFPVEEYELMFIDGEDIDCKLFEALRVNQATFDDSCASIGRITRILFPLQGSVCYRLTASCFVNLLVPGQNIYTGTTQMNYSYFILIKSITYKCRYISRG